MTPRRRVTRAVAILGSFVLGVGIAVVGVAAPANAYTITQTFTTAGAHSFTVPAGITTMHVEALGGTGGNGWDTRVAGAGALVTADVPVTGGATVFALVGGNGEVNGGGANGGGSGGNFGSAGGGGGASDVRTAAADLTTRLVVAAGGGGTSAFSSGGNAGTPDGADGAAGGGCADPVATGATTSTFGTGGGGCGFDGTDGSSGQGGTGGERQAGNNGGGGGGGGWFGGGGGGAFGGGGGGSSFVTASATASAFALGSVGDAPYVTVSFVVIPSVMSVAVSPSSIVPDGSSTATVTATVTDDFGNGVPGEVVTFSSTDLGQVFGAVTDHGDGTYSATVTSSTTAGVATITGTDTSTDLSATAALTQAAVLAATGSDPGFAPGLALLLVLVGGALVVIRRTRHAASIR